MHMLAMLVHMSRVSRSVEEAERQQGSGTGTQAQVGFAIRHLPLRSDPPRWSSLRT